MQKCNFGTELYYQLSPFYHDFALWGHSFLEVGLDILITCVFLKVAYSHLFNKRGGWNKREGGAKVAKSLNVEAGINVEGGFFGKN